jgi:hypothetical protein
MDIEARLERLSTVVRFAGLIWAVFFAVLAVWAGFKVPHDQVPLLLFALTGAAGYGAGLTCAWILQATAAKMEERIWVHEVELHKLDDEVAVPAPRVRGTVSDAEKECGQNAPAARAQPRRFHHPVS